MKDTTAVQYLMSPDPICVAENTKLVKLLDIMNEHALNHLPVISENRLVGIISKQDVVKRLRQIIFKTSGRAYSNFIFNSVEAKNIMTQEPIYLQKDDTLAYASELLLQGQFHSLPVVDEELRPIGIITTFDLLKALYQN